MHEFNSSTESSLYLYFPSFPYHFGHACIRSDAWNCKIVGVLKSSIVNGIAFFAPWLIIKNSMLHTWMMMQSNQARHSRHTAVTNQNERKNDELFLMKHISWSNKIEWKMSSAPNRRRRGSTIPFRRRLMKNDNCLCFVCESRFIQTVSFLSFFHLILSVCTQQSWVVILTFARCFGLILYFLR